MGFSQSSNEMEPSSIDAAIARLSKSKCWIFTIFVLTSSPGILNSMHISSYIFLAENPTVWCDIPELNKSNWTMDQIRTISMPDLQVKESCSMYNWNYSYFGQIGYNKSIEFVNSEKQVLIKCNQYSYNETIASVVSEWNLVCENDFLKSFVHAAIATGKFAGAFFFGMVADRFGRKRVFISSCIIYLFSGPLTIFMPYFTLFLVMRFLIGVAGAGAYEAGYTLLTEMTVKKYRTSLGCLYNISYSIGLVILPILAYESQTWRQLQIFISLPAVFLLIHCWYLPESPRWLLTQGRYKEAFKILKIDIQSIELCESNFGKPFNSDNFAVNVYIYTALNGLVEAPAYIVPLVILNFIGRKLTSVLLFFIGGFALLIILVIPAGTPIMVVALIGRFCISAVYAVVILYTSELFPTSHRNTAIGTSLTMAQFGTIIAPFIVDFMGKKAWYLPSTFCGTLCVITGTLMLLLPETWNRPLPDTVPDIKKTNRTVSFKNSCNFL